MSVRARSPTTAAKDAHYLYDHSIRLEGVARAIQELGKGLANGTWDIGSAIDRLIPMLREEFAIQREQLADGLHLSFLASGQNAYAQAVADGRFDDLRLALQAAGEHTWLESLDHLTAGIETYAYELLTDAEDEALRPSFIDRQEVRLRPDTAPEVIKALKLDPDAALDLTTVINLFAGQTADGNPIKGRQPHPRTVSWIDLGSINATKSISLLHAFAPSQEAAAGIERAHKGAIDAALRDVVADRLGLIRGTNRVGDITWIQFMQTVSRYGDPHLHSHVAILNVTVGDNGKVAAMNTKGLSGQMVPLVEAYHRYLHADLQRLGYEVGIDLEHRYTHAIGIPERVERAFSQGQRKINDRIDSYERTNSMEPWQREKLNQIVGGWQPKQNEDTTPELWEQKAEELGWEPADLYPDDHSWEQRILAEAQTLEWQRMATGRGWIWVAPRPGLTPDRSPLQSSEDRKFAVRMPDGGFHRGGSQEMDWALGGPSSRGEYRDVGLER